MVQAALVIFSIGSVVAATAPNMGVLIGARAFQGLGVGGLTALVQVVIASMVSPRERGRYSGYIGAVFATATVSGPLLGGLVVDSPLGWRGCFIVGIPVAIVAFVVLQKTLHLPTIKREVKIDYVGATLIMSGISLILVWVSLAGTNFDWISGTSAALVAGSIVLIGAALWVEAKVASEPVIPLRLFRDRTTALATAASVMIGVAMFGATVYLSQYFQARPRDEPDRGRPDVDRDGRRTARLQHRQRPGHHPHRAVEALAGRRHGDGHRRHLAARHDRRGDPAGRGRSLHGDRRCGPRCHHAEPGALGAEQHRPRGPRCRQARWSRCSAPSVAPPVSPRSARCSPTRSAAASRTASCRLVKAGKISQEQTRSDAALHRRHPGPEVAARADPLALRGLVR
nr:MFS transporter [Nocardioides convexus]